MKKLTSEEKSKAIALLIKIAEEEFCDEKALMKELFEIVGNHKATDTMTKDNYPWLIYWAQQIALADSQIGCAGNQLEEAEWVHDLDAGLDRIVLFFNDKRPVGA